jgi:hypothetical protein
MARSPKETAVDIVLPSLGSTPTADLVAALRASGPVGRIIILGSGGAHPDSTAAVSAALRAVASPWVLWITKPRRIAPGQGMLSRFLALGEASGAALVYSDRIDMAGGNATMHPVIDYQEGSVRDDFDFGPLLFVRSAAAKKAMKGIARLKFGYAGLYALRLALSRAGSVLRVPEMLYAQEEIDLRASGEKQFDYVDPRNREYQVEMEKAATDHLKRIGAWLRPAFASPDLAAGRFPVEATVVIPVKDRAATIGDAVASVVRQRTGFPFNVIVVDNHSTDGTSEFLRRASEADYRVIHHIPERLDLGIGGCWNEAVNHPSCGRIVVQLDSDDLYAGEGTVQRIVEVFHRERCGAVVGSYRMTDFDLQPIPPGVIDHREWTVDNGRNNALRINGFGAPRAFATALIRKNPFPNVSYGEDYAVMLAVSRLHRIGRIYDPIYLCRRWKGNSDADLDIATQNRYNLYKDRFRTIEIAARQQLNERRG